MKLIGINPAVCCIFLSAWFLTTLAHHPLGSATAQSPQSGPKKDPTASKPLVLVHYMPWFAAPPISREWGWHWTKNRFNPDTLTEDRRQIASHYDPLIGPYDSGDPDVLEYHGYR